MATCLETEDVYGPVPYDTPAWNGSAASVEGLTGSGYYSFQVSVNVVGLTVGLTRVVQQQGYSHIEHGLYFSRGTVQVIESGKLLGTVFSFTADSIFHIVRSVNVVYYCKSSTIGGPYPGLPGDTLATSIVHSSGTVFLGTSLYNIGDSILSMSLFPLSSGGAYGRFALQGISADVAGTYALGYFGVSGEASGKMEAGANGCFFIRGLSSETDYAEARGFLQFGGEASSLLAPFVNSAVGTFSLVGSSSGAEYLPVEVYGNFALPGKISDLPYGELSGGFRLYGHSQGGRVGLANFFSISLVLRDQTDPNAIARFAPIKAFPGYEKEDYQISIPLGDLVGLTAADCDPSTGDWTKIAKAMLLAIKDQYDSLAAEEKPVMARPWVLEGVSVSPVANDDMVTLQQVKTTIQYNFIIDYATQMVVTE